MGRRRPTDTRKGRVLWSPPLDLSVPVSTGTIRQADQHPLTTKRGKLFWSVTAAQVVVTPSFVAQYIRQADSTRNRISRGHVTWVPQVVIPIYPANYIRQADQHYSNRRKGSIFWTPVVPPFVGSQPITPQYIRQADHFQVNKRRGQIFSPGQNIQLIPKLIQSDRKASLNRRTGRVLWVAPTAPVIIPPSFTPQVTRQADHYNLTTHRSRISWVPTAAPVIIPTFVPIVVRQSDHYQIRTRRGQVFWIVPAQQIISVPTFIAQIIRQAHRFDTARKQGRILRSPITDLTIHSIIHNSHRTYTFRTRNGKYIQIPIILPPLAPNIITKRRVVNYTRHGKIIQVPVTIIIPQIQALPPGFITRPRFFAPGRKAWFQPVPLIGLAPVPTIVPSSRTIIIKSENRKIVIGNEDRKIVIHHENRTMLMTSVTKSIPYVVKNAGEDLDYELDYLNDPADPYLAVGETITSSSFVVDSADITIGTTSIGVDDTSTIVWLSGGILDEQYLVTNTILTSGGRTGQRAFQVRMRVK